MNFHPRPLPAAVIYSAYPQGGIVQAATTSPAASGRGMMTCQRSNNIYKTFHVCVYSVALQGCVYAHSSCYVNVGLLFLDALHSQPARDISFCSAGRLFVRHQRPHPYIQLTSRLRFCCLRTQRQAYSYYQNKLMRKPTCLRVMTDDDQA